MHALLSQDFPAHFSMRVRETSVHLGLSIWASSEEPSSELSYLLHEHFQLCMNQLVKFRKCERIMQCQEKVDPN